MEYSQASLIASRLASGALRRDAPIKTRFARGNDGACAGCALVITTAQFACESRFADRVMLRFHRDCYHVWHAERVLPPYWRWIDWSA